MLLAFVNEYRLVVLPVTDESGRTRKGTTQARTVLTRTKAEKYGRNTGFAKHSESREDRPFYAKGVLFDMGCGWAKTDRRKQPRHRHPLDWTKHEKQKIISRGEDNRARQPAFCPCACSALNTVKQHNPLCFCVSTFTVHKAFKRVLTCRP